MSENAKNNLKLLIKNQEGLKVISAYIQDSVVAVKDIVFLKQNRIFIMMINRFMWEDVEKGIFRNYKRIKSVLRFNFIDSVSAKNIKQKQKNRNLELLTIKSSYTKDDIFHIHLIFSGNGVMLLKSEEIDLLLDDQDYFWEVKLPPKHKI